MRHENKIKFITVLLFVVLIITIGIGVIKDKKLSNKISKEAQISNEENKRISDSLPEVVCWGDGLTEGVEGDGVTYPQVLANLSKLEVHNMGVSGEDIKAISARQGARQIMVNNITIPADTEKVQIGAYYDLFDSEDELLRINDDKGINDCVIAGVKGEIILSKPDELTNDNLKYYFKRHESGEEIKITEPTPVITDASISRKDDMAIIFIGENGGWESIYDLLNEQNNMIDYIGHDNYIILGLTTGSALERHDLEQLMESEFKDKYINLRKYLSTEGLEDADIDPTDEDLENMEIGKVPTSLLSNDINGNAKFYELIGKKVFEKIIELEYLNEEQIKYLNIK